MPVPYGEAFLHSPPSSPSSTRTSTWGPYSNADEFGASMLIILVTLLSSLIFALALITVVRFLICGHRHPPQQASANDLGMQAAKMELSVTEKLPTLVISEATKLGGADAVCAICLSEFVNGDTVTVLPACSHGFHVTCIEGWLASHCSCPTCRSSCRVAVEKGGMEEA